MNLSIKHKLLLTILAAISLVVISIHLIGQWNFQRGFIRFVNTTEQSRLEQLASNMQDLYAEEGSWGELRNRPGRWISSCALLWLIMPKNSPKAMKRMVFEANAMFVTPKV